MPLTAPAHQAVVLPLKLLWPARTDATALCIGAAAPDLGYPLFGIDSHSPVGVVAFAVPLTLVAAWVLRHRAALGVFAQLPDAGPFRLRSYRVLVHRRPGWIMTLTCALIGAVSHVVVDAFTHQGRWGAEWFGLDHVLFSALVVGEMTGARVLQYAGHILGSLASIAMFAHIGRAQLLERWYGADLVEASRDVQPNLWNRVRFASATAVGVLVAVALTRSGGGSPIFAVLLGGTIGALAGGWWTAGKHPDGPTVARPRQDSNLRPSD